MKGLNAVSLLVSVSVTVQSACPVQLGKDSTTCGLNVMDVSELTVTLVAQVLSVLFHRALPEAFPLHLNWIWLTLLKLAPTAERIAV